MLIETLDTLRKIVTEVRGDPSISMSYNKDNGGLHIQVNLYFPKTQGFLIHQRTFSADELVTMEDESALIDLFINECNDRFGRVVE